ncbi:unnamed protein product [Pleuronectes platessa]|uniref:Uncharacterized protein n=1 Tax=Pleuronectes platessa TaxID=8262 RepID=A0A9N7VR43_PLEPL|nr:unnamed protein product [Pleuronectes platessa]
MALSNRPVIWFVLWNHLFELQTALLCEYTVLSPLLSALISVWRQSVYAGTALTFSGLAQADPRDTHPWRSVSDDTEQVARLRGKVDSCHPRPFFVSALRSSRCLRECRLWLAHQKLRPLATRSQFPSCVAPLCLRQFPVACQILSDGLIISCLQSTTPPPPSLTVKTRSESHNLHGPSVE